MLYRHGIQHEIEGFGGRFHLAVVGGDDNMVGALFLRLGHLAFGASEDGDLRAQGLGEFHAHMAEAAHADNAHFVARSNAVVA